jgi:hypothetical protein
MQFDRSLMITRTSANSLEMALGSSHISAVRLERALAGSRMLISRVCQFYVCLQVTFYYVI